MSNAPQLVRGSEVSWDLNKVLTRLFMHDADVRAQVQDALAPHGFSIDDAFLPDWRFVESGAR